jgi:hypothetical protein
VLACGAAVGARRLALFLRRAAGGGRQLALRAASSDRTRRGLERARATLAGTRAGLAWSLCASATAVLLAGLVLVPTFLFTKRVHVGTIGVQQAQWGGGGVVERDFEPGLWRSLRGWHTWHLLDGRTHFLTFGYPSDGAEHPILDLRTRDGNVVKAAVTVPYRIRAGEGHRLVAEGLRTSYRELVVAVARNLLSQELAELTSSDLANTELRLARLDRTLELLNARLQPLHLVAETIQVHQVFFWMSYETKLQAKQLTRQNALLAEAVTQVEEEKRSDLIAEEIVAEEQRLRAEMDKVIEQARAEAFRRIAEIKREAQNRNVLRRAEADAVYAREVAAGELALARAEALRDELVQAAMASPGGRLMLAREAAGKLRVESVTLDSRDPDVPSMLDLDELVELLIGREP